MKAHSYDVSVGNNVAPPLDVHATKHCRHAANDVGLASFLHAALGSDPASALTAL